MRKSLKILIIVLAVFLAAGIYIPTKGYFFLRSEYNYRAASLADLKWQLLDSNGSRVYHTLQQNISEVELTDGLTVRRASAQDVIEQEKVYIAYIGIPTPLGRRYQLLQADYDLMRVDIKPARQNGESAAIKTTYYFLSYKDGLLIEVISDQPFSDSNDGPLYSYEMNGEYTQFFYLMEFPGEDYILSSDSVRVTAADLRNWLEKSSLAQFLEK